MEADRLPTHSFPAETALASLLAHVKLLPQCSILVYAVLIHETVKVFGLEPVLPPVSVCKFALILRQWQRIFASDVIEHAHSFLLSLDGWSAWGDLHSQGCSILSRTGLLFPVNHTPVGDPGLAPGRLGDFKSPGSAVPAEASRREIGGHEGTCTPKAARF